ncbi:NUDIX hydrolase [Lactobacillus taiwanensis]|uniref:NTP pyrophosphohydrolase n=1 Tax=Lactobacillus taiwanensis TaxID=508451 RepID=A0A256LEI7_9LACO|nr:NUDIX hydrolase [Lactobacillus taiwanensis]OYR87311.1 NTP pyrophosphohydrolase [Lactobacillus taiwanensis]OYR90111.1 NTP pyrophosphohydrolase [Lactobacillus taiwanensis]OYR90932.1 NTP pyrophosphohydrolase [Lactobacillus taiwanensis]OYR96786.1 NTP pyrophosphohydrolase [Lactobacillus taiwanensis]
MTQDYIKTLRKKVGHEPIILNFSGGILTNNQNEILLQKRSDFNAWGLPGGALEFGESAQEACVREFLEETGLKVRTKSLLGLSTNFIQYYPNQDVAQAVTIEFIVELVEKTSKEVSSETFDLKYFSKDKLPKIFNKQHQLFIDHYFNGDYPFID